MQKRVHRIIASELDHVDSAGTGISGDPSSPLPTPRPYYRRPLWLAGIGCMLIGALVSFGVFSLLGQARASAFAALTIIWSGLLSYRCLGEALTLVDLLSAAIILAGATIAAVYGSAGASSQSSQDLDSALAPLQTRNSLYAASSVAMGTVLIAMAVRVCAARSSDHRDSLKRGECMARVALAGVFSGSTGMLARDLVVSFTGAVRSGTGAGVLVRWQLYLLIASLPLSLILQLGYLNSALRQLDSLEVVPPYQASIIVIGVLWGWGFSAEGVGVAAFDLGMFGLGCGISAVGVLVLLAKRPLQAALSTRGTLSFACTHRDSCFCVRRGGSCAQYAEPTHSAPQRGDSDVEGVASQRTQASHTGAAATPYQPNLPPAPKLQRRSVHMPPDALQAGSADSPRTPLMTVEVSHGHSRPLAHDAVTGPSVEATVGGVAQPPLSEGGDTSVRRRGQSVAGSATPSSHPQ